MHPRSRTTGAQCQTQLAQSIILSFFKWTITPYSRRRYPHKLHNKNTLTNFDFFSLQNCWVNISTKSLSEGSLTYFRVCNILIKAYTYIKSSLWSISVSLCITIILLLNAYLEVCLDGWKMNYGLLPNITMVTKGLPDVFYVSIYGFYEYFELCHMLAKHVIMKHQAFCGVGAADEGRVNPGHLTGQARGRRLNVQVVPWRQIDRISEDKTWRCSY